MVPTLKMDVSGLNRAVAAYVPTTRKSLPEIVNQRALNVFGRAFDKIPPANPIGKRSEIKRYLTQPLSQKIRPAKTGKARFLKAGKKANQLQRVHLIVQARRRKEGKPGLYGQAMRSAAGAFKARAQISVGFVKSLLLPVLRGLWPVTRFHGFPKTRMNDISVWPNSAGYGSVAPARAGDKSFATFVVGANLKKAGADARVRSIVASALQQGINEESTEMMAHVRSKMIEDARRAGFKVAA